MKVTPVRALFGVNDDALKQAAEAESPDKLLQKIKD